MVPIAAGARGPPSTTVLPANRKDEVVDRAACRLLEQMIKRMLSEVGFRLGRRTGSPRLLEWSSRQDPHWLRPAIELARQGDPSAVGRCLLNALAALRNCAITQGGMHGDASGFLKALAENLERSRGQCFQDVAALSFARRTRDGYFLEVGTGNGDLHSNTRMLEQHFGWTGILFEPDRRYHAALRQHRSARIETRPAFSKDGYAVRFLESHRHGALSTIEGFEGQDGRRRRGTSNAMRSVTLNTALSEAGAPTTIDYVSIDTEGSELEVLAGLDLTRWDVRFMTIEHNYVEGKRERIAEMLAPRGFRAVLPEFSCMDVWLVREPV